MKKQVMKRAWEIYRQLIGGDRIARISVAMKQAWKEFKTSKSSRFSVLAEITGSEKQIKYATDIRNAVIVKLKEEFEQTVEYPENKKKSYYFNSKVIDADNFIQSVCRLNRYAWSATYIRTGYIDPLEFNVCLYNCFLSIMPKNFEFKNLSDEEKLRIFNEGYKKAKTIAFEFIKRLLEQVGDSEFWIDNFRGILYK